MAKAPASEASHRSRLQRAARALDWKWDTIMLATVTGRESKAAEVCCGLAVHTSTSYDDVLDDGPPTWTVTHAASGLAFKTGILSVTEARVLASRLLPLTDWTQPHETIPAALPPGTGRWIGDLCRDPYRRDGTTDGIGVDFISKEEPTHAE